MTKKKELQNRIDFLEAENQSLASHLIDLGRERAHDRGVDDHVLFLLIRILDAFREVGLDIELVKRDQIVEREED